MYGMDVLKSGVWSSVGRRPTRNIIVSTRDRNRKSDKNDKKKIRDGDIKTPSDYRVSNKKDKT